MTRTATMTRRRPTGPAGLPRLLALDGDGRAEAVTLAHHHHRHGPLPYQGAPHALIEQIRAAGLTGRGGAAFPMAVKMAAVAGGRRPAVVAANGAEGEPASGKDKLLLWASPHLVLDGLQLAAEVVGARRAYLYLHRSERLEERLHEALAERAAGRCDRVPVRVVTAPPRFLAGEESALARRIGGDLALPAVKPPRVFERGAGGAPTLVQNVETLAHAALVARYGPEWFREIGTVTQPGSMLVTCHHSDGTAAVTEVATGSPLAGVLGMASPPAQAVLVGGYHGTWIPAGRAARLSLADTDMRQAGAALGAGVLAALPAGRCGLAESARVAHYLAAESAGQCGPCRNGLPSIAHALARLAGPAPDPRWTADLRRWTGLVAGRGACHHPDGTARFVRSTLSVFGGEIERHRQGRCTGDRAPGVAGHPEPPFLPVPAGAPADWRDWS